MKDYYDVHMFLTKSKSEINIENLKLAIKSTFDRRESMNFLKDYEQILDEITSNERIVKLWDGYTKKNKYANGIKLELIIGELKSFISNVDLNLEVVNV